MSRNVHPLTVSSGVTCLMVTLPVPERLAFARRSIDDFCRQTHKNKTLILLVNGGVESVRHDLRDYVASLKRTDIRILNPEGELSLGHLRNLSLEAATDPVVCQWDDDDLYHPQRLEKQLACLVEGDLEAVYLQDVMQYYPVAGALYWTNWRATAAAGHPGTLMMRHANGLRYPAEGANAKLGEDTVFANALIERGRVGYLTGQPHLFLYVSHGANSWNDAHHRMLSDQLSISKALLQRREADIRGGLTPFNLSGVTVHGNNGEAFAL